MQGGVSRTFVRDGSYVTDPVLRDGQATYTPGVSERRGGVSTWSHSGLKNADAQTSSVGAIAATRVYDAFGAELSATGTWKGPFGYAGGFGYQEDSSGLKLLGHRYYDPTTGRFLSRDPIKDGRNWYVYCESSPLSRRDPLGLGWHDPVSVTVSAAFEGEVIAYGDFPWMPREGWRDTRVRPGQVTHPDMDVDMIRIKKPDGSLRFVFLLGEGMAYDGFEQRTCYYVNPDGTISKNPTQVPSLTVGGWKWLPVWSAWIAEASSTGFPEGYQPRQSLTEPCRAWE
ncbi:hypothetical protein CCB81_12970 [Armatimonadetes bacterium Uphvl-Ar2]|nr:hypothetical protein CCB81_12970 [Armatimonadetes bacterium Uphvl-Ar2]